MAIVVKKNKTTTALHWVNARPGRVISLSFLTVILIGTVLLVLPAASQDRQSNRSAAGVVYGDVGDVCNRTGYRRYCDALVGIWQSRHYFPDPDPAVSDW